jgi:hypothetical protein
MTDNEIDDTVKASMQQQLDTDRNLSPYHMKVQSVMVANKSGNQYQGMAVVRSAKGIDHNVHFDVTVDGTRVLWEAPPGSFVFAETDQLDTQAPTPQTGEVVLPN